MGINKKTASERSFGGKSNTVIITPKVQSIIAIVRGRKRKKRKSKREKGEIELYEREK